MTVLRQAVPVPVLTALAVVLLLAPGPVAALARPTAPSPPVGADRLPNPHCPPLPDPSQFVAQIDNPYLPLVPGTTFTYRETADGHVQQDVVEVTHDTKEILGVTATVVLDTTTTQGGNPVEKTFDWYAQDRDGNVWYFGEDTKEYKHGHVVSTKGSWEAGVHGAKPGIIMEANPQAGDAYRQECASNVAQDTARVRQVGASVTVPFGSFDNVLVTKEWTPLERGVIENKYHAPCVGEVRAVLVKGGHEESVLVDVQGPAQGGTTCNNRSGR